MEMLITPEWLRSRIKTEPDIDVEAGMFLSRDVVPKRPEDEERSLKLKHAFGVVVRCMRLRDGITIEALAEAASVLVEDIEKIERDPHFKASPRTIYHLAKVFKIAPAKMLKISGAATVLEDDLENETLKFAAKSDGVSSLNREEQRLVNEFVKYLNKA